MNGPGHHITGAITGATCAAYLVGQQGAPVATAALCVVGGWIGGVFPDRFERIGRWQWLPHRTVTHWVPIWAGLVCFLLAHPGLNGLNHAAQIYPLLLGFGSGCLTHILFDWPNPMGVPWILPFWRQSLHLWNSGRADFLLTVIWALLAGLAAVVMNQDMTGGAIAMTHF